jgi:hypothetical protein
MLTEVIKMKQLKNSIKIMIFLLQAPVLFAAPGLESGAGTVELHPLLSSSVFELRSNALHVMQEEFKTLYYFNDSAHLKQLLEIDASRASQSNVAYPSFTLTNINSILWKKDLFSTHLKDLEVFLIVLDAACRLQEWDKLSFFCETFLVKMASCDIWEPHSNADEFFLDFVNILETLFQYYAKSATFDQFVNFAQKMITPLDQVIKKMHLQMNLAFYKGEMVDVYLKRTDIFFQFYKNFLPLVFELDWSPYTKEVDKAGICPPALEKLISFLQNVLNYCAWYCVKENKLSVLMSLNRQFEKKLLKENLMISIASITGEDLYIFRDFVKKVQHLDLGFLAFKYFLAYAYEHERFNKNTRLASLKYKSFLKQVHDHLYRENRYEDVIALYEQWFLLIPLEEHLFDFQKIDEDCLTEDFLTQVQWSHMFLENDLKDDPRYLKLNEKRSILRQKMKHKTPGALPY